jgi:hypothetical protein
MIQTKKTTKTRAALYCAFCRFQLETNTVDGFYLRDWRPEDARAARRGLAFLRAELGGGCELTFCDLCAKFALPFEAVTS